MSILKGGKIVSKLTIQNERVIFKFQEHLRVKNKGYSEATINRVIRSIRYYQEFTKNTDFRNFNSTKALKFSQFLKSETDYGKSLSLSTIDSYLRDLRMFFSWLSEQPGYKSKIIKTDIEHFGLSRRELNISNNEKPKVIPSLDYAHQLTGFIEIKTEVDMRDQALIAFTILTGMRDHAIITLPLGCIDEDNLIIRQDPDLGVHTKFGKYILSLIFKFDDKLVSYVLDWIKFLREKGFNDNDPVFPKALRKQDSNNLSFGLADKVSNKFLTDTGIIRSIFKIRAETANLKYYPPHSFRHLHDQLVLKYCKNGEQIKAASQHLGHKSPSTTISVYGKYAPNQLVEILKDINNNIEEAKGFEEQQVTVPCLLTKNPWIKLPQKKCQ